MTEQALFAAFWAKEGKTTLKVLQRIPEGSQYRPDPKARRAQEIAWAVCCEEECIIDALETGKMSWNPAPMPATMAEIAKHYARRNAAFAKRWKALSAKRWKGKINLFGKSRSASELAWSFFHDIIHHRGQISTYLRPMGSTVPQIYGPSGDEP